MRLAFIQPIVAGNAFRDRFAHPVSIKSLLLFGAIIAIFVGIGIAISVATRKRDEKKPQNIEKFFDDDELETKKLERTLSVALIAVAVIAIGMALYYVWEPSRQAKMTTSFDTRSVRRGQTLFANESMVGYNNVQSLQCANCHGGYDAETGRYANGGTANYTLKSLKDPLTDPACAGDKKYTNVDCITVSVPWKAPALNTALYKYPIRKAEADNPMKSTCTLADQRTTPDCRSQVFDIITYGRAGTPMPAWGVPGGGPKNEQAINDLVNFLTTIQLPADQAAQPIRSGEIIKQKKKIETAQTALDAAKEKALEGGASPSEVNDTDAVKAAQAALLAEKATLKVIESKTETQFIREAAIADAQASVDAAQKAVDGDAPEGLNKAQAEYDASFVAYRAEGALQAFGNPQDFLDKLEKDQLEINLEKAIELLKTKGTAPKDVQDVLAKIEKTSGKKYKAKIKELDAGLVETQRIKNIAQNFIEARDALATAKATKTVFAPEALANSKARLAQLQSESDGQLLFESNCARCHTKGWSYFTPSDARIPLPAPQGTGALGPNLSGAGAGGGVVRQFVNPSDQFNFISAGSIFQAPYGSRGIGTGRMPGFNSASGRLLTDDQISQIVAYEREGLTGLGQNSLGVRNLGTGNVTGSSGNSTNVNSGISQDATKSTNGASSSKEGK